MLKITDSARGVLPLGSSGSRLALIDTMKAVGVFLVVLGHAPGTPNVAVTYIYSFHIPLFFLLAGYLLGISRVRAPLIESAKQSIRLLLVPYCFFFCLSFIYWLPTRNLGDRAAKFAGVHISNAFYGLLTGLANDLFVNVTLWFFPCLFMCRMIYFLGRKIFSWQFCVFVICVLSVFIMTYSLPWFSRLPWGLDIVWVALVFYITGHALRECNLNLNFFVRKKFLFLPITAFFGFLWMYLVPMQGRVDLAMANFGVHPLWYIPIAFLGILFLVGISVFLPDNIFTKWLAENSLIIFPVHPLVINFLSGVVKYINISDFFLVHNVVWSIFVSIGSILIIFPISVFLRRYLPVMLGASPSVSIRGGV